MLPALLGLLFKKPKLLLLLAVVFGLFYFLDGGGSGDQGGGGVISKLARLATGAEFDPALYDQAEVFEPLADNVNAPLPERVSLEPYCPPRMDQGQQGSCVAWASAYAARTIVEAKATKADPRTAAFSPSYLYNQIKIPNSGCQGAYIFKAMEQMLRGGVLPFSQFGYTDQSCNKMPEAHEERQAQRHRIKGFQRLTLGADDQRTDMLAMKQHLSQGSPVVIGMMVGGTFMQDMEGQEAWIPTRTDLRMPRFGGHAMCVVGYDDYKFGDTGGFLIMNSWGPRWGVDGLAWVAYPVFDHFAREAYAVHPQGDGVDARPSEFDVRLGFRENEGGKPIALRSAGNGIFRSAAPIARGTRFKVEVTNNTECYVYIFGQETDGSTYVLFPYTAKHSPYCGITGTRLFPRDHSLMADSIGTNDVIAVVIYDRPIDYPRVNSLLSGNPARDMAAKVQAVLGEELNTGVEYTDGATIGMRCSTIRPAMAAVLELEKR